jgi:repressor LexA
VRGLTDRQQEVYRFVVDFVDDRGYPPSIRDITRHFGFRSPKAAADHLAALERKGFIRRAPELSRAIEIPARLAKTAGAARAVSVPLVGRIAAGAPLLAVENIDDTLVLDSAFVRGDGAFFLRVVGDSMVDAHIVDGDLILVKPQETAQPGEIVVALIGHEATVKRYFPEEGRVRLQPENPRLAPIYAGPDDDFRLIGRVIGLVRDVP